MALFSKISGRVSRNSAGGLFGTVAAPPVVPVHHVPTSTRELRAQAVHRMQVGLFGLAGMLLMVSLANVIMDRAQQADEGAVSVAASASAEPANDPLVDMGVAPELPVGAANAPAKSAKRGQNN